MAAGLQAYVHVTQFRNDGFVEFNFALGDPSLYIEMILPRAAFQEFCENNKAIELSTEQAKYVDDQELKWRFGTADPAELSEITEQITGGNLCK